MEAFELKKGLLTNLNVNGYEICTHKIYLDEYSQQILMFEMLHFNHMMFLIAINIFNARLQLASFNNVTILLYKLS